MPESGAVPFADMASALDEICSWEEHRIHFTNEQVLRGGIDPASVFLDGQRQRLKGLQAARQFIRRMSMADAGKLSELFPDLAA